LCFILQDAPRNPEEKFKRFFVFENAKIYGAIQEGMGGSKEQADVFFSRKWSPAFKNAKLNIKVDHDPKNRKNFLSTYYSPMFKIEKGELKCLVKGVKCVKEQSGGITESTMFNLGKKI
jgi:hypothetical protein